MKMKKLLSLLLAFAVLSLVLCFCIPVGAVDSAAPTEETPMWITALSTILPFGLLIVVFYFFLLRPQKKQQKEAQAMRDSVGRGDTVVTNGGIVGIVITVKDDMVLLESSGDKTKIQVQKWAISTVLEKAE